MSQPFLCTICGKLFARGSNEQIQAALEKTKEALVREFGDWKTDTDICDDCYEIMIPENQQQIHSFSPKILDQFHEGQQVQVVTLPDEWRQGKILVIQYYIEFPDGSGGTFESEFIRPLPPTKEVVNG